LKRAKEEHDKLLLRLGRLEGDLLLGRTLGKNGPEGERTISVTSRTRGGRIQNALVLGDLNLLLLSLSALERAKVSAALETLGGNKALDLGTVVREVS
jgi:hypothetical protein